MQQTTHAWPTAVLAHTPSYRPREVQAAVNRIFNAWEGADQVAGRLVVVKPNLLMKRRPQEATTTHPAVVQAVASRLWQLGAAQVIIADSPGGPYHPSLLSGIYQATGMEEVAQATGAQLNLDCSSAPAQCPGGRLCREFPLIRPVHRAVSGEGLVISVGKLKTHCMTGLSGGVKNLFGCIPGLQKPELHYRFQRREDFCAMLADLALLVQPALTILDGVEAMEGDGPSAGTKRHAQLLAGCSSPFVLDRLLCQWMGFSPEEVPTVAEGIRRGLCPQTFQDIPVLRVGEVPWQLPFVKPNTKPVDFAGHLPRLLARPARYLGNRLLAAKPLVQAKSCVGCGRCAQSCPAKVIRLEGGKAKIDDAHCIHCFCCHEMCPVKAIRVTRPLFSRLAGGAGRQR